MSVTLCELCKRQIAGNAAASVETAAEPHQCILCFGLLDPSFISEVAKVVGTSLENLPYDANSFILALNLPTSQTLREIVLKKLRPDFDGILISVPFKIRCIDAYLAELSKASGLRPTLHSDLQLTITLENDEFNGYDYQFLSAHFPQDFAISKKQWFKGDIVSDCSKDKLQQLKNRLTSEIISKMKLKPPTKICSIAVSFERDTVFIGGRYCKFSRVLPQSPWSPEEKSAPKEDGNSVSEKICDSLKSVFGASSSTFIASGREDIDVRMLGSGRPFVVELRNCRITKNIRRDLYIDTLKEVEKLINKHIDIKVNSLTRVTKEDAEKMSVGEEEKRKLYTAYCYSTIPLQDNFKSAASSAPIDIVQKTPVRVFKRRALLDRIRTIYQLGFIKIDEHHFSAKLETQAGTYIKEFVHGDFGRTRPSLADLLQVENGEVDILELDVEKVDQEWPPKVEKPLHFR